MIKTRVIPLLLLQDGLLKKPVAFRNPRTVANPISIVRVFEARRVDELVLLDIGCGPQHKNVNPDIVRMIAEELTVPFACGGGVSSLEQASDLISAGAENWWRSMPALPLSHAAPLQVRAVGAVWKGCGSLHALGAPPPAASQYWQRQV